MMLASLAVALCCEEAEETRRAGKEKKCLLEMESRDSKQGFLIENKNCNTSSSLIRVNENYVVYEKGPRVGNEQ